MMIFLAFITKAGYLKSYGKSIHIYEALNTTLKETFSTYCIIILHPFHKTNKNSIKTKFNSLLLITSPSFTQFNSFLKKEASLLTLILILLALITSSMLFNTLEKNIAHLNKTSATLHMIPIQFKKDRSTVNNILFENLLSLQNTYTLYYIHATLHDFILSILIQDQQNIQRYISDISKQFPDYKCTFYSMNASQHILTIYGNIHEK